MGVATREVLQTVGDPAVSYPGRPGPDGTEREVRVRGRLAVVVAPATKTVITVLWNGGEGRTYHQPDQAA